MFTQNIKFKKGWNLISFNLLNIKIDNIKNDKRILEIVDFNKNVINNLDINSIYFINSLEEFTLTIEGNEITYNNLNTLSLYRTENINLNKGWNCLKFNLNNIRLETLTNNDNILEIKSGNKYYNIKNKKLSTLDNILPNVSYFIYSKEKFQLNVNGILENEKNNIYDNNLTWMFTQKPIIDKIELNKDEINVIPFTNNIDLEFGIDSFKSKFQNYIENENSTNLSIVKGNLIKKIIFNTRGNNDLADIIRNINFNIDLSKNHFISNDKDEENTDNSLLSTKYYLESNDKKLSIFNLYHEWFFNTGDLKNIYKTGLKLEESIDISINTSSLNSENIYKNSLEYHLIKNKDVMKELKLNQENETKEYFDDGTFKFKSHAFNIILPAELDETVDIDQIYFDSKENKDIEYLGSDKDSKVLFYLKVGSTYEQIKEKIINL